MKLWRAAAMLLCAVALVPLSSTASTPDPVKLAGVGAFNVVHSKIAVSSGAAD